MPAAEADAFSDVGLSLVNLVTDLGRNLIHILDAGRASRRFFTTFLLKFDKPEAMAYTS